MRAIASAFPSDILDRASDRSIIRPSGSHSCSISVSVSAHTSIPGRLATMPDMVAIIALRCSVSKSAALSCFFLLFLLVDPFGRPRPFFFGSSSFFFSSVLPGSFTATSPGTFCFCSSVRFPAVPPDPPDPFPPVRPPVDRLEPESLSFPCFPSV